MKDTALLDEGDGCLQVLSHSKLQHDAGQPPPARIINRKSRTCISETWPLLITQNLTNCLPAKGRCCDFLCQGQILFSGDESNTVTNGKNILCEANNTPSVTVNIHIHCKLFNLVLINQPRPCFMVSLFCQIVNFINKWQHSRTWIFHVTSSVLINFRRMTEGGLSNTILVRETGYIILMDALK